MGERCRAKEDRNGGVPCPGADPYGSSGYAGLPYTTMGARINVTHPFPLPGWNIPEAV
jgi:hypothetical protein